MREPFYKMGRAWGRWEHSRNSFVLLMLNMSFLLDRCPRGGVESIDSCEERAAHMNLGQELRACLSTNTISSTLKMYPEAFLTIPIAAVAQDTCSSYQDYSHSLTAVLCTPLPPGLLFSLAPLLPRPQT